MDVQQPHTVEEHERREPISRSIYVHELPEVAPVTVNANFRAKITLRSSLSVIDHINTVLTEKYKKQFRRRTQLGYLIDLPTDSNFWGMLTHNLLLRKMECQKQNEIWFNLKGKPLRFSLNEFVLITGLYTSGGPSKQEIDAQLQNSRLMKKHWPGKDSVTVQDVHDKLRDLMEKKTEDRVKLAFVYLVAGFLLVNNPKSKIRSWIFSYADDLDFFDDYPWGDLCYRQLIDTLNGVDMKTKWRDRVSKKMKENEWSTYTILSCPFIFQIWAFEAMPKLGDELAIRQHSKTPRWLSWQLKNLPRKSLLKTNLKMMESPEFSVRPILHPSLDEKSRTYYRRLGSFNDNEDEIVDRLTEFLSGDVILSTGNQSHEREEDDISYVNEHVASPILRESTRDSTPPQPATGPATIDTRGFDTAPGDSTTSLASLIEPILVNQMTMMTDLAELKENQRTMLTEINELRETQSVIKTEITEMKETQRVIIDKLNILNDLEAPSHNSGQLEETLKRSESTDEVGLTGGDDRDVDTYMDPVTICNNEQDGIVEGGGVVSVCGKDRDLRLRKRAHTELSPFMELSKKAKYSKSVPPNIDPFKAVTGDHLQAFRFAACHTRCSSFSSNVEAHLVKPGITPELDCTGNQSPRSGGNHLLFRNSFSLDEVGKKFLMSTQNDIKERLVDMCAIGLKIGNLEEQLEMLIEHKKEVEQTMKELQDSGPPCLPDRFSTIEEVVEGIRKRGHSAAAFLCDISRIDPFRESANEVAKDVIGIVALLGRVHSPPLSRVLSEYLSSDQMLAIVVRSFESACALERYRQNGEVDYGHTLQAEASKLGKSITKKFLAICLEDISPFEGESERDDPQHKLLLRAPCLFNSSAPPGFLGFAVNLIDLDEEQLSVQTDSGHGLRETLFYHLFGKLQVYRTRAEMLAARGCIKHGAVSLDGGILKEHGVIIFGCGSAEICFQVVATTENETPDSRELMNRLDETRSELKKTNEALAEVIEDHAEKKKRFEAMKDEYDKLVDMVAPFLGTQGNARLL